MYLSIAQRNAGTLQLREQAGNLETAPQHRDASNDRNHRNSGLNTTGRKRPGPTGRRTNLTDLTETVGNDLTGTEGTEHDGHSHEAIVTVNKPRRRTGRA
jgi:hypothetical protein